MMSSGFNTSDPLVLDHPGVASWLASLATVSHALLAAPDEARLLALLSQATRPALGNFCALYVLDSSGVPRPVLPPEPAATSATAHLHAYEAQAHAATDEYVRIMLDGQTITVSEVTPAWLEPFATSPNHLALLRSVDLRSVVLAPLTMRGQPVGLLLVGSTGHARPYSRGDLALIQHLATLAASTLAGHVIERREAALRARVDELIRAARELAHLVNNDLTLPVGTLEILLDQPDQPAELREMLAAAVSDLAAAERHIRGFHELARRGTATGPSQGGTPPPTAGSQPA